MNKIKHKELNWVLFEEGFVGNMVNFFWATQSIHVSYSYGIIELELTIGRKDTSLLEKF